MVENGTKADWMPYKVPDYKLACPIWIFNRNYSSSALSYSVLTIPVLTSPVPPFRLSPSRLPEHYSSHHHLLHQHLIAHQLYQAGACRLIPQFIILASQA